MEFFENAIWNKVKEEQNIQLDFNYENHFEDMNKFCKFLVQNLPKRFRY